LVRTLCVANQKGGVGKTTTAINLASALAKSGKQTLLIDLDPQCNATSGVGFQPSEHHALLATEPLRESVENVHCRLDILPGSRRFKDVDLLANAEGTEAAVLLDHLANGTRRYEFVILDCPPSLGTLTRLALSASTEVFMPIQCEYFAMEGLTQMIETIREVMQARPGQLEFGGILLTMHDSSLELTREIDAEVRDFFGEIVFDTVIPRDVRIAESPSFGKSVIEYAPRSKGTRAYIELCMEVLESD
jgi:chromosome partitioning protein